MKNPLTWTGGGGVHGPRLAAASRTLRVTAHPALAPLTTGGPGSQCGLTSQRCNKTYTPPVTYTQNNNNEIQLNESFPFSDILSVSFSYLQKSHRYSRLVTSKQLKLFRI